MLNSEKHAIVSVITPCYNQAAYLTETLDCLIAQTYSQWECLVMDDGSTDGSLAIAQAFSQEDRRIHWAVQPNQGPSAARNHAIALTKGKYILPLDADDKIDPTYIEKAIKALIENPKVKIVYTNAQFFGRLNQPMDLKPYSYEELLRGNIIPITALYRREDYIKSGGYDENMKSGWEDWDFWLSMLGPEDKVLKIEEPLFNYRRKEISRNDAVSEEEAYALRKYIYEKHFETYKEHFEDPVNLAYRVKMLERDVRHLRNKDWETRLKRKWSNLFTLFKGKKE